ncbi:MULTISPECIES: FAD-linked oxidase C-terminal domain-containing protein [unclassified Cryobacterium]|uniref:FAD-linked oxidase C-terminal domain-containing protein n=1 Tax=unclassified Cryobacterium TaxID=2649013 RepID=UPI0014469C40
MSVLDSLRAELGDAVSVDQAQLTQVRTDKSGHASSAPPIAVVNARNAGDVQATLRLASEHRVPVVPRGAGTGLAGGAIGGEGEIVLSTLGMNRILELSVADQLAVVEPGILNGDFNDSLREHGLWFAPDPASRAISTIGGNIATNAGGLLCAKYGVTREAVLGLKVVLADGRMLTLGHRTVKGVTGLDLTALMIGSEGTLGVIVEATVRVRPLPRGGAVSIAAYFADVTNAAVASAAITAAGLQPAVMEIIDSRGLEAIDDHLGVDLSSLGAVHLLVQTDGPAAEAEADEALRIIRSQGGEATMSSDPAEAERLLAIRRAFHPSLAARGTVLIEDVAVPRSKLPDMFREITRIEREYGIPIPTVAHAGDGNLHPNFVVTGEIDDTVWRAAGEVFEAALRLGGTLTGEHGVGTLKKRWLAAELGSDQLELQRQVKAVFDPHGILNPGKVF